MPWALFGKPVDAFTSHGAVMLPRYLEPFIGRCTGDIEIILDIAAQNIAVKAIVAHRHEIPPPLHPKIGLQERRLFFRRRRAEGIVLAEPKDTPFVVAGRRQKT